VKAFGCVVVAFLAVAAGAAGAARPYRDGRILFVTSFDAGFGRHPNIVAVDPSTGERATIAPANVDTENPATSRDGRRLAFVRGFQEGGPLRGLYVSDGSGRHVRRIAPFGLSPTWSPDASGLAYVRDQHVVVMRADGTHRRLLALRNVLRVAWSPRGDRLLVARGRDGCCLQLVRPDGTGLTTVLRVPKDEKVEHPTWSPDGRRIAFEHDTGCAGLTCSAGATVIATVSGRVLQTMRDAFYLTWSPSGKRVAYGTGDGVFVRSLADSSTTQVFKGTLETFGIAWQPR
jgi:Tol biopolymer transport system component